MLLNFRITQMATIMNFIQITANSFNEMFVCVFYSFVNLQLFIFPAFP